MTHNELEQYFEILKEEILVLKDRVRRLEMSNAYLVNDTERLKNEIDELNRLVGRNL